MKLIQRPVSLVSLTLAGLGLLASPVLAHHPSGGNTPSNFVEGFLSGLGHPVIGLDHLAFVIAAGLLAALFSRGLWIPVAFVVTSMVGTLLHLAGVNLPALELAISASVLLAGVLLALRTQPQALWGIALGAIAGIFHGYAYGEAVIGAGMGPVVAYLAGFTIIQLAIALGAYCLARSLVGTETQPGPQKLSLRFAGFTLCGVGLTFLSSALLG